MSKNVVMQLTQNQRRLLMPLFSQLAELNRTRTESDFGGCICAQIYPDGMIATVLDNQGAKALADAINRNPEGKTSGSLIERLLDNKESNHG